MTVIMLATLQDWMDSSTELLSEDCFLFNTSLFDYGYGSYVHSYAKHRPKSAATVCFVLV